MARPRLHDEDAILAAAEEMIAAAGAGGLTIRALSARSGASTGTLYHAFGSRTELLGRVWLRAAGAYMDCLERLVGEAVQGAAPERRGEEATIAAAGTFSVLRRERPSSARLLISHRRRDLLDRDLPEDLAGELAALERRLQAAMRQLAQLLWGRRDRAAIDTVAVCIADLPTALLAGEAQRRRVDSEALLAATVRAVLAHEPG